MGSKKAWEMQNLAVALLLILVVLAIIFVFFWGEQSLYSKVAAATSGWTDRLFTGMRDKEHQKPEQKVDESMKSRLGSLKGELEAAANLKDKAPCIMKRQEFPDDLEGYSYKFMSNNDETVIQLHGEKQEVDTVQIKGIRICVVDGDGANNFYQDCILKNICGNENQYRIISQAEIKEGELREYDLWKAKIEYNGKTEDIEDQGLMFMPKPGLLCFLPTKDGNARIPWTDELNCDGDEILDDDCIDVIKNKINDKSLKSCLRG